VSAPHTTEKATTRIILALTCLIIVSSSAAQGRFCLTDDTLLFGNRAVGSMSTTTVTVSNCGNQAWSFTDVSVDPATGAAWHVNTSCSTGLVLSAGAACSVAVIFAPTTTGQTSGGVWLRNTTNTPDELLVFYGRGVDAQAGTASLAFAPAALNFGAQNVGVQSAGITVALVNNGPARLTPSALVINGPAAYDYYTEGDCNVGTAIPPGSSCTLTFFFRPAALGNRPANLVVDAPQLANLAILAIDGTGAMLGGADADVVEFFYSPANHYFLTASATEAALLDAGGIWVRTGFQFRAWSVGNAAAGTLPVCRFTGTPDVGPNSHFFTANAAECAIVQTNPYWWYEGLAFRTLTPTAGACAAGMTPVVRFFWAGSAVTLSRHRYVVDPTEVARMRAAGWLEEGTVFCAPP
jgi:hypothetical protein